MNPIAWKNDMQMIKIVILAAVMATVPLLAEGNGSFSGAFLRIGLGARGMAMGNAQVATANNGYGAYYNPAALPVLENRQFAMSYSSMSLDRRFNYVGIAIPMKPVAGASFGWINSGVGDLRSYNSIGEDTGEFNHGLNAIYGSFGLKLIALAQADKQLMSLPADLINIGLSVKFLLEDVSDNEEFNYDGSGFGVDLGLLLNLHRNFKVGYQLKDLNASLSSNTNDLFERGSSLDNNFPTTQKVGVYYNTPLEWASVAYDFEWSNKGTEKHHVGAELRSDIATGRFGYDHDHLTLGGGLIFSATRGIRMALDYAFIDDVVDEGVSHVFSWRFLF